MRWSLRMIGGTEKQNKGSEIGYLYGETDNYIDQSGSGARKIAGFDMDQTLITTKSGKKFPTDSEDWKWQYENVKETLNIYHSKGYSIIIVTNQAGIKSDVKKLNELKEKVQSLEQDLLTSYPGLRFQIYCAIFKDVHRKPFPTFLESMNIDRSKSFFCGDGAGRQKDHTSGDIKFAYNLRIKFRTPEYIFLGDKGSEGLISYPIVPYSKDVMNAKKYEYVPNPGLIPELIIMVGFPGSGKSYVARNIAEQSMIRGINIDVISLDQTRTKPKMMSMIKRSTESNHTMIIDNTNLEMSARTDLISFVINISKMYYVRVIHVDTPLERCIHNNLYRYYVNHMTDRKLVPDLVYRMMKNKFVKPSVYGIKHEIKDLIGCTVETVNPGVPLDPRYFYYFF